MALKVYSSGNYIITDTGTVMHEFAKGYTTYSYNQSTQVFTIRETVGGSFTVTRAQVLAGDITNELNVAYNFSTFETFLRENTGFKTAPGGSGAAPIGAKLLKTGQTISYKTNDDGDLEAGRNTSFLALLGFNPYGNLKRFLDELGTEVFTNKIVIDWSTFDGTSVLGYYSLIATTPNTWNDAVEEASALSIGTYTNKWRLCNIRELTNLFDYSKNNVMNYAPFSIVSADSFWTSTTYAPATFTAWYSDQYGQMNIQSKTSQTGLSYIACRTFTVTGTTLT